MPSKLIPFFVYILKPYKWYVFGLFMTGVFFASWSAYLAPYTLKIVIDRAANKEFDNIQAPLLAYVAIFFASCAGFRLNDWLSMKLFPAIKESIINQMFAYTHGHSYGYFQNNFAGSIANKISEASTAVASIMEKLDIASANMLVLIVGSITLFWVNPLFGVILIVWGVLFIGLSLLFTKKTFYLSQDFSKGRSGLMGAMVDSLSNFTNTLFFARSRYEIARTAEIVRGTVAKDRAMHFYILKMRIVQDITIVILMGSMLCGLVFLYGRGVVTIGDFTLVLTISTNVFQVIWFLSSQFVQFADDLGKCSQGLTVINIDHDVVDAENATELKVTKGNIEFKKVTFFYHRNSNIFHDVNVKIKSGQKVGLVGFSGSGKTTFAHLVQRVFDIDGGQILIDGQDISQVTKESLRSNIAMIPQDTTLFHRSLMENIRYGKIDAADDEVIEAAKKARCHEFIEKLPEGYSSLVGERGIKLSGGQRQRIAIARALLKNAPILILDEATSALDSVTEKYIQESLGEIMRKRTVIVVAHRLSTLSEMDRILVFDKGCIIEDGVHDSLVAANGHYAKLWHMQAGGFLPDNLN